jgi:hypothetical protein
MYFNTKNYLKNNYYYIAKHALILFNSVGFLSRRDNRLI